MVRVGLGDMERKGGKGGEKEGEGGGGKGGGCMIRHESLPANQTLQTQVLHKIFANSNRYQQDGTGVGGGGWKGGGQAMQKVKLAKNLQQDRVARIMTNVKQNLRSACRSLRTVLFFLKWRVILRNLSPSDPLHGMTRPFF